MRLAKHLAHAGIASRRASEALIAAGRITVDGVTADDPARDVDGSEDIRFDGEPVGTAAPPRRTVILLNKPAGVVSTAKDTHRRRTVVDLVRAPPGVRLYPVGRLDAETTGLILLTDDGDLAHHLTHPSFEVAKTYHATVEKRARLSPATLRSLREGVVLDDGRTAPAKVRQLAPGELELVIHEGRKRQVRRMLEAVGHPVVALRRVQLGPIRLGDLAEGKSRVLSPAEVEALRMA